MKSKIKEYIKRIVPARWLEFFSHKAITITKIPNKGSIVSDLFILRIENGWETHFEFLQFDSLLNPSRQISSTNVFFYFYSKDGEYLMKKEISIPEKIKTTININKIASEFELKEDCLFAVFHPQKKYWINGYDSFISERGYIGYSNLKKGGIRGFVHGNHDAIALSKKNKFQLLANYSFFKKQYYLQHLLESKFTYELFLVNPSSSKQMATITETFDNSLKKTRVIIPAGGMYKYFKPVDKKKSNSNIIIETKLYLARPVVFKIMSTSFDVFHG